MAKSVSIQEKNAGGMFTEKELQIIRMICAQATNEEMAVKLKKSLRTVEGYRATILDKMKVRNTAGLVIYAVKTGIYKIR